MNPAKNHKSQIEFSKLSQENLSLTEFHDASFENLLNGGSQGLFVINHVDNVGNSNPSISTSKRIKRVVKSTLAAVTRSLAEVAKNAYFFSKIY